MPQVARLLGTFGADVVHEARRLSRELGPLRNSLLGADARERGFVGELAFACWLRGIPTPVVHEGTYNHDMRAGPQRLTLEMKTKKTSVLAVPPNHYDNTVNGANLHQRANFYVWVRVKYDSCGGTLWYCGALPCDKFRRHPAGKRYSKGDVDPSNGHKFRAPCRNIAIGHCWPLHRLLKSLGIGRHVACTAAAAPAPLRRLRLPQPPPCTAPQCPLRQPPAPAPAACAKSKDQVATPSTGDQDQQQQDDKQRNRGPFDRSACLKSGAVGQDDAAVQRAVAS